MSEERIVVCMRVAHMGRAAVASDMEHCVACGMAVWLARSTPRGRGEIYCMPCALDKVELDDDLQIEPIDDAQLADLLRREWQ